MQFTEFLKAQQCPECVISGTSWLQKNPKIGAPPVFMAGLGGSVFAFNQWGLLPAVYIIMIILPLILGMAGKIEFKWVILWEIILFLPIGIILFVFFGGALLALFKKA